LKDAIDSIPLLAARYGPDGTIDFVNRTWRTYAGISSASLGDGGGTITHPEDRPRVEEKWREYMKTGEAFETEQRLRRYDGEYRWHLVRYAPMRDDDGDISAWYGAGYDINDQKIAQPVLLKGHAQIAAAEPELRLMLDLIPTLAWRTRPDGHADYLNKRWLDYTGFSLEQSLGWDWQAAIHPNDRPALLGAWQTMLKTGCLKEVEARMRRFDGSYRWFLFRTEALRDDNGNVIAWFGTNTDIEDRKRAENALQRSEAYSAEAQKLSMTGSIALHIESNSHFWSDEAYQIMGFDRSTKLTTKLILDHIHPADRARFLHEAKRARDGAQDFDFEQRLFMPDGKIKHLRLRAHRVKYESGREEIVGALMDVTEAKKSQEAVDIERTALNHANRVATLGEINATIAHEVNQPLAAIIVNAETCLRRLSSEGFDPYKVRRNIEWIVRDASRAADVIQGVRKLVRKADANKVPLDINCVIREVNALLERELNSQHVDLRLALSPSIPLIMGDRVQLQQVIINLIMNAAEATQSIPNSEHSLVVFSSHDEARGVVVSVKDNGIGIADEAKTRVFEAFFSTKPNGLGIGLSICRSILEDHEGRLSASNNSGEPGATFEFELPPLPNPARLSSC
jgi:hypothetical protein